MSGQDIPHLVQTVADMIHCPFHEETCWTCGAPWTGCSCGEDCGFTKACECETEAHDALAQLATRVPVQEPAA